MATNKDYSVGYKFTGDAAGFQRAVGSMQTSIDKLTGTKTKVMNWATTFLSVGAAIEGFKKVMNSTEGSADALDKVMGSLEGSIQGVLRTIATGDWGAFSQNIKNAANATRDLKVAMDSLEDISASNRLKKGRLGAELEGVKVSIAGTTDPGQKQALIKQALDLQKTITGIDIDEQQQRIDAKYNYYRTLINQDDKYWNYLKKQIPVIAENWQYFGSESTKAGLEARKSTLEYYKSLNIISSEQAKELSNTKLLLFALEDYKKLKDDLSKPGEFNKFVDDLTALNEITAKGEQDLIKLTGKLTTSQMNLEPPSKVKVKKPGKTGSTITASGMFEGADKIRPYGGMSLKDIQAIVEENKLTQALDTVNGAVGALENTFTQFFTNIGGGWQGMIESMMNSFKLLVAQIMAKIGVFILLNALTGGSGMIAKVATRALGTGGLGGFLVPGFANGTNFAPGGLALVGERGPELVNLPRGSQVRPFSAGSSQERLLTTLHGTDIDVSLRRTYKNYDRLA